jgi:hypothetical protein
VVGFQNQFNGFIISMNCICLSTSGFDCVLSSNSFSIRLEFSYLFSTLILQFRVEYNVSPYN